MALSASGNKGRYGVEQEEHAPPWHAIHLDSPPEEKEVPEGVKYDAVLRRAATGDLKPSVTKPTSECSSESEVTSSSSDVYSQPEVRKSRHSESRKRIEPAKPKPTRAALKEAQRQKEEQIVKEFRKAISEGKDPGEAAREIEQKYGVKIEVREVKFEPKKEPETLDRVEAIAHGKLHPQEREHHDKSVLERVEETAARAREQLDAARLELMKIGDQVGPVERFGVGMALFGVGVAAGAVNIVQSTVHVARTTVERGPIEAGKELAYGTYEWLTHVPQRLITGLSGNPFVAGELVGEVVGGYYLGKGAAKVAGGPLGKVKVLTEQRIGKIRGTYIEQPGIKFVESYTYEPVPGDVLVQQVAGRKATLVHMTQHKAFDVKPGEQILLEAKPEAASGFRKQFDALHWYQSAPAPTGEPLGYLAYVGIGEAVSETVRFTLRKPKIQAIVTHDVIEYVKPRPGESFVEYQVRTGQMSGKTLIPGENVFGYSTERQVITPTHFESQLVQGLEYPGTYLRKVRDVGWTHYRQSTLPGWLEGTKLGRFLQKLGYGERYHKIHISEWEKISVETAKRAEKIARESLELEERTLDLARYNEEYGRVRYISASEIISSIVRTGLFLGYSVGSYSRSGRSSSRPLASEFGGESVISSGPRQRSSRGRIGSRSPGSSGKSKGGGYSGYGGSGGSGYSGYGSGYGGGYSGYGSGGSGYSGYGYGGSGISGGGNPKMPIGAAKTERRYRRPKERFRFWLYVNPVATPYELLFGRGGRRARGRKVKKVKKARRRR